jgi:hypothetical protein
VAYALWYRNRQIDSVTPLVVDPSPIVHRGLVPRRITCHSHQPVGSYLKSQANPMRDDEGKRNTYDMLRIDLLDETGILLKVDMCTEGDLVHRHLPINLVAMNTDKVVGLFQEVLRGA